MGEAKHCVQAGSMWGISVPSAQYCCEPVTALKNNFKGRLGGSVKYLPSTQAMILESWIEPHVRFCALRGACFSLCPSPLMLSFSHSLSNKIKS